MSHQGLCCSKFDRLARDVSAAGVSGSWITRNCIEHMPSLGGAYILALELDRTVHVKFATGVAGQLEPGWYVYAGSARGSGGIRARVRRHFREQKPVHWHIDLLTTRVRDMAALAVADGCECELVRKLLDSGQFWPALAGFGSTDCRRCESHLLTACAR